MRHGSLFSGIGGFDLAAEWMGWENVFHCEWMPFPRKILNYYWPKSINYENICTTDFTPHRGNIDILTGGFPCQPYSSAGKRLGKEDERHLWPHMRRAIREIEPTWVVGENVRGLTNWSGGVVFEEVCADLEACGYEVQPVLLPACAVGTPHRRDRIWFVAYSNSNGFNQCDSQNEKHPGKTRFDALNDVNENDEQWNVVNSMRERCEGSIPTNIFGQFSNEKNSNEINLLSIRRWRKKLSFERFPTQSPICGGDDGLPTELDGITFSKWRNESIKGYGNAVVPQLVLSIFKTIEKINNETSQRNP